MLRFDHDSQRCLRIETRLTNNLGDISWDTNGEHAQIRTDNGTTLTYPPETPVVPGLEVLEPANGATVAGAFTMAGTASAEDVGISGVEVQFDSGAWAITDGTERWRLDVDASSMANGFHRLRIRAWSFDGTSAEAVLGINVANPVLPPEIRIIAPADGASISGMVQVKGTSSSCSGPVERVDIRLDGNDWMALTGIDGWLVTLDTTTFSNGIHRIQARAWDGRSCTVTTIKVTVTNERPSETVPEPAAPSTPPPPPRNPAVPPLSEQNDPSTTPDPAPPAGMPAPAAVPPKGTTYAGTIKVPMVSGGILLLAALAIATEHGKYALFQFLFVPLYSRIKKDRVLDNFTRGMIYGFIMSNPGVHYNFIKQKLGLNNGSIVYHLTVLERQELIKSERVGLYKRFYPVNGTLNESGIMELNDEQSRLLELVRGDGAQRKGGELPHRPPSALAARHDRKGRQGGKALRHRAHAGLLSPPRKRTSRIPVRRMHIRALRAICPAPVVIYEPLLNNKLFIWIVRLSQFSR
jgi:DNA-binding transcriptional ArsR family regulator